MHALYMYMKLNRTNRKEKKNMYDEKI